MAKINLNQPVIAKGIATIACPLMVYILLFAVRFPEMRSFSRFIRYNSVLLLPVLLILIVLVFRLRGWVGVVTGITVTLALFGLTLIGLWSTGLDNYYAISGILPWSDARNYFTEASRLLQGFKFTPYVAWHPLFPASLAVLLALTGSNLQMTGAILAGMVASACYLASAEVRRTHGAVAGAFVWILLFTYYRQFNGTLVSENLGLTFGALGFALLWRGAANRHARTVLAGLFFTTLGLTSRLGTFFILPAVILWGSWLFKNKSSFSWSFFTRATATVILGFVPYALGVLLLAPPQQLLFPNYASTFYDFSTGYRFWGSLRDDHPDIYVLPDPEVSIDSYQLAFEEIRQHPQKIASGVLKQYETFLGRDWYSAYSFIETRSGIAVILVNGILYLLCILGFVRFWRNRHDPLNGLVAAASLGLLVSVPFIPPGMFNRMRLYAASLPVLAALPCLGLVSITDFIQQHFARMDTQYPKQSAVAWIKSLVQPPGHDLPNHLTLICASTLFAFFLIGVVAVFIFSRPTPFNEISCPEGTQAVYLNYSGGSQVNVIQNDEDGFNWLPYFQVDRFKRYLHDYAPHYLAMEEFEKLQPPATIIIGMDLKSKQDLTLITNSTLLPQPPALLGICGHISDNPKVASDSFFYAQDIKLLPSPR